MAKDQFGFDRLREQVVESIVDEMDWHRESAIGASPIEKLLFAALHAKIQFGMSEYDELLVVGKLGLESMKETAEVQYRRLAIIVEPQRQFNWGRADFVIHAYDYGNRTGRVAGWYGLIVECDGHEFHERTKAQASKDKGRDRSAQQSGMAVYRFTGSDIWRDPMGCANEVLLWCLRGF